jgi:pyruvate formate lyase activating enzyme
MTPAEVIDEVIKDRAFYDQSGGGVTFTGGEPLLQAEFLETLLRCARSAAIHTAVETSGFCDWDILSQIASSTDLFLYDLKLIDPEQHRSFTGVSSGRILKNLVNLSRGGHEAIVRMPILPGINDHEANLAATLEFLTAETTVKEIHLLPFHKIGMDKSLRLGNQNTMPDLPTPTDDRMNMISAFFRKGGLRVAIGG